MQTRDPRSSSAVALARVLFQTVVDLPCPIDRSASADTIDPRPSTLTSEVREAAAVFIVCQSIVLPMRA